MKGINVQVILAPGAEPPAWGRVVLLPARREQDSIEAPCDNCVGTGALPRGSRCDKCAGTGAGRWIRAVRVEIGPQATELRAEVRAYLDRVRGSRYQVTVPLTESGGGRTNTGSATIVAGMHGERLRGYGGKAKCGAIHVYFYTFRGLEIVYSQHRGNGDGSVTLHEAGREDLVCRSSQLYEWTDVDRVISEIREIATRPGIEFPAEAAEAAMEKARCYHCRSAFYVAAGGAQGPSGALRGAGAAFGGLPSPQKGPGIGYTPT